jgi:plastocyanin
MHSTQTFPGIRRAAAVAAVFASSLFLVGVPIAVAGSPAVSITETSGKYGFQPANITIGVGQTVTWTNNSDAPHTVTSDAAGGPMDGSISSTGNTYQATFDSAGDFAYHCEVHDYMHGSVHVAAVPPTDLSSTSSPSAPGSGGMNPLFLILAGFGSLLALTALRLRLRQRQDPA